MEGMMTTLAGGGLAGFTMLVVLKTTLLLAIAAGATWTFRHRSAAVRHGIWTLAAVGVLSLPLASANVRMDVPLLPVQGGEVLATPTYAPAVQVNADRPATSAAAPAASESNEVAAATGASGQPGGTQAGLGLDLGQILFGAWGIVALGLLARIGGGVLSLRRITRSAEPLNGGREGRMLERVRGEAGVTRAVRLVRSDWSDVPMTWGAFRPVVHLPAASVEWDDERLHVVLEHEMAHVRRWDVLTLAVARAATALHWFNPMAWVAERGLRDEAERASDDLVLRSGTVPSAYAEHLLELARGHVPGRIPATVLPMAHRSRFEGRLMAILHPEADRGSLNMRKLIASGVVAGLGFVALAAAVPVSAVPPVPLAGDTGAETIVVEGLSDSDVADVLSEPGVAAILDEALGTAPPASMRESVASRGEASVTVQEVTDADRAALEDPRSVAALSRALLEDTEVEVRRVAAWALGQIEDPAATPALITALGRDGDAEVRRTVVWAMGQLEDSRAVDALIGVLDDSDTEVRRQAVWALGQIEVESAVPGLTRALNDPEAKVRRQAVWALGQIESVESVTPLLGVLDDPDPEARSQAAWALGQIESDRAVSGLVSALGDAEAEVRSQSAWALGQIESDEALDGLLRALANDSAPQVRRQAAWAIGQVEPNTAPQALLDAMHDSDAEVREQALWAVRQIEDPASVSAVVELLSSDDLRTQIDALHALAGIRNEAAIQAIAALLENDNADIREAAARALAGNRSWANPRPRPRPRPQPRPRPNGNDNDGAGS